jgi:hypothetical protein
MTKKSKRNLKKSRRSLKEVYQEDYNDRESGGFGGQQLLDISNYEEVEFYQVKKGENAIDIIPYEVKSKRHPKGRKIGSLDYKLSVAAHKSGAGALEGSILCLKYTFGKPCPICEERKRMLDSGQFSKDDEEIKKLNFSKRVIYNVIDTQEPDKGIQLFSTSDYEVQKEIIEKAKYSAKGEGEFIAFADLDEGYTVTFRGAKRLGDYKGFKPKDFDFEEREENYNEDILNDVYQLDEMLCIPTYKEVKNIFLGIGNEEEDEVEEDEVEEDEVEEDEVEEDEVEEDEVEEDEVEEHKSLRKKQNKTRTRKTSIKKKKIKSKCIAGGVFGQDCEEYEEFCNQCHEETPDIWEECAEKSGE